MPNGIAALFAEERGSCSYRTRDLILLCLILAIGTLLRFWGLGDVGLFDDEETMAMPAMAILETGHPYMPSGALYLRALPHTYLIAASAWLFGESEWSFRLPSAIVGSLTGLAAFFMGRRFLPPAYNLAFVATITLLPGMIDMSQTARMYVFLITGLVLFTACIFRWEQDQRPMSLLLCLVVWTVTLAFHKLAVFAALLFLFPGLSRVSPRLLTQGAIALLVAGWLFQSFERIPPMLYPEGRVRPPALDRAERQSGLEVIIQDQDWLLVAGVVIVVALVMIGVLRVVSDRGWRYAGPLLLVGAGLLAMALLHYYVGSLLLLAGTVTWLRSSLLPRTWLLAAMALAAAIAAVQIVALQAGGLHSARKIIGGMVGQPSVWPLLRFLSYSPAAAVLFAASMTVALIRFTRGIPLPVHFLFFGIGVFAPLFAIGFFDWSVPPRYASGQLAAFLLCVFAGLAYLLQDVAPSKGMSLGPKSTSIVLVLISAALINPFELARTVNPGYDVRPDHKGAAEYIESLQLPPDGILIAEDVLQQTYYLGQVDYWLRQIDDAHRFSMVRDGRVVDNYTATPILGTGAELADVLEGRSGRNVYIIGSGEDFVGQTRLFRGRGIQEVLDSALLEVVYEGRDGKTKVWKLKH